MNAEGFVNFFRCFFRHFLCAIFLCICFYNSSFAVEILDLNTALQNTYRACVGIDDKLSDYKTLAGINTGVQAVGTGLGVGATVVGIVKVSTDKAAESYEQILKELREKTKNVEYKTLTDDDKAKFEKEFDVSFDTAVEDIDNYKSELDKLTAKSKKLGNWRTGLLATNTATNVAGAILASQSGQNKDLQSMVKNCLESVDALNMSIGQARVNGEDVSEAKEIASACGEYRSIDVKSISKRATGAMAASIVGAATGATGTITSAVANTDKIRNDNTNAGKKKEKDLNTASNVLAGATAVASATSTVFSGTQIAAIKRVANVASKCEGVLK